MGRCISMLPLQNFATVAPFLFMIAVLLGCRGPVTAPAVATGKVSSAAFPIIRVVAHPLYERRIDPANWAIMMRPRGDQFVILKAGNQEYHVLYQDYGDISIHVGILGREKEYTFYIGVRDSEGINKYFIQKIEENGRIIFERGVSIYRDGIYKNYGIADPRPITYATGTGTDRDTISVKYARSFNPRSAASAGDGVQIGKGKDWQYAEVLEVVDGTHLKLNKKVSWKDGDWVTFPFKVKAPDISANESGDD